MNDSDTPMDPFRQLLGRLKALEMAVTELIASSPDREGIGQRLEESSTLDLAEGEPITRRAVAEAKVARMALNLMTGRPPELGAHGFPEPDEPGATLGQPAGFQTQVFAQPRKPQKRD
ncbi:MAG TPA: hypothetical protein VFA75_07135 [Nevskia sp.]|nr:hypothetical protein [Nevskia sp.]